MKYVITGSTGNISKPLTRQLKAAGHEVTVISSSGSKTVEIKDIGAHAAIGSVQDRQFLIQTFAGADAVYLMIPPMATSTDWFSSQKEIADNYLAAVETNKIKYVLMLSSMGAHMGNGAGPVDAYAYLEKKMALLAGTHVHVLRPSSFFNNLYGQIGMIKKAGFVGSTQPADFRLILTAPSDIASAGATYLLAPSSEPFFIEYVASDDSNTWADITRVLGSAIGKPDLPYVQLTDEQSRAGMLQAGLSATMADGLTALGKAIREGDMQADYWKSPYKTIGKVKLTDFAKLFAAAYSAA